MDENKPDMKYILQILSFCFILLVAILLTGVFLPADIKLNQSITVKVVPEIVFNQLNDLNNWINWSDWFKEARVSQNNNISGKGSQLAFDQSNYGEGIVSITHSSDNESIAVDFDFNNNSSLSALYTIKETNGECLITSDFELKKLTLTEKFLAQFNKKELELIMNSDLSNLANYCDELKYDRIGKIHVNDLEPVHAVLVVDSVSSDLVNVRKNEMIEYLMRFLNSRDLDTNGKPFMIRYGLVNDTLQKFACGIPLSERTWVWKTLQYMQLPDSTALSVSYFGNKDISKAYDALNNYAKDNNYEPKLAWQIEMFDPETDPDTSLWETKVYMAVDRKSEE